MNNDVFAELSESIRQAGAIKRGEAKPSRRFEIAAPDVRHIRSRFSASQSRFADIIGVSINTIQNWEQGRCVPTGPARVLLAVADRNPELLIKTIDAERAEDKRRLAFA